MIEIPEMKQKNREKLLVLKIIPFVSGTTDSHNLEQHISHWQSMCYETPLRFNVSLRERFPKSGSPIVLKKYDESALRQISHDLGLFNMLIVKGVSEMVFFKEWSNQGFHSL